MVETAQDMNDHAARREHTAMAVAPVRGGESDANASAVQPIKSESENALKAWKSDSFDPWLKKVRTRAIELTPSFIVNYSSNIFGVTHVITEGMMFKSAMKEGTRLVKEPSNPVSWVVDPVKTIFSETFARSKAHGIRDLFKGNFFKNFYVRVTDLEAAAERYRMRPEVLAEARAQAVIELGAHAGEATIGSLAQDIAKKAKLSSPWQFRSTFIGMVTWGLGAILPERKESEEEIERLSIKRQVNLPGYIAERVKQALWFPEWHKHKPQMVGLGYSMIGISSMIGAWRGRTSVPLLAHGKPLHVDGKLVKVDAYTRNLGYFFTGALSFLASIPLMFASDEQRAYGGYGAIMLGRIPPLSSSIYRKYNPENGTSPDPGRHWYLWSAVSFQVQNMLQALVGGAQKKVLPDGSIEIVDHEDIRNIARMKASEQRQLSAQIKKNDMLKSGMPQGPGTKVEGAVMMQERLAGADAQLSAPRD